MWQRCHGIMWLHCRWRGAQMSRRIARHPTSWQGRQYGPVVRSIMISPSALTVTPALTVHHIPSPTFSESWRYLSKKINVVMTKSGDLWWLSNREAVCVGAGWDDGKMCVEWSVECGAWDQSMSRAGREPWATSAWPERGAMTWVLSAQPAWAAYTGSHGRLRRGVRGTISFS